MTDIDPLTVPFTAEDWVSRFTEINSDAGMLNGYLVCSKRTAFALDRIVETAKNFEELRQEILAFAQAQRDLNNDIDEKWYNSDDPQIYGLPRLD